VIVRRPVVDVGQPAFVGMATEQATTGPEYLLLLLYSFRTGNLLLNFLYFIRPQLNWGTKAKARSISSQSILLMIYALNRTSWGGLKL